MLGTSLQVFSAYRFVVRAQERRIPIAIVNLGETRGDSLATLKVEQNTGDVLAALAQRLDHLAATDSRYGFTYER